MIIIISMIFVGPISWINVGVEKDPDSMLNPLKMLLQDYTEEDLIIVKLDIDNSEIEIALADQLVKDSRFDKLIDQFFFEHHFHMREVAPNWGSSMGGNAKASIELFRTLRTKGIPAQYWV